MACIFSRCLVIRGGLIEGMEEEERAGEIMKLSWMFRGFDGLTQRREAYEFQQSAV